MRASVSWTCAQNQPDESVIIFPMMSGLESARRKLIRASEHIKAIKDSIATYAASDPFEVIPKAGGKEQFNIIREPPTEVSVLSGEVLYQIRSALDHLIFDLVKLNPQRIRLPDGWERRCEFPLLVEVPTKGNPPIAYDLPVPYNLFATNLPGITRQAFTFIESVQPYNPRGQGILGSLNTLKALVKLSLDHVDSFMLLCQRVHQKTARAAGWELDSFGRHKKKGATYDGRSHVVPPLSHLRSIARSMP